MNDFVTNITLDLNCNKDTPTINSAQFDKGRKFSVAITANGEPFSVAGCDATLKCVHSDKSSTSLDCTAGISQAGTTVTVTIREDTLPVRGLTAAKLVFTDGTRNYSTQIFIIDVDSSLDGNIRATEAYSIINKLIDQVHALNESGLIIIDNELSSESTQPVENRVVKAALDALNQNKASKEDLSGIVTALENRFELLLSVAFDGSGVPLKMLNKTTLSAGDFTGNSVVTAFVSNGVTLLNSGAFSNCENLSDIYLDWKQSDVVIAETTSSAVSGKLVINPGSLPNNVTIHYKGSFNATGLIIASLIYLNANKANSSSIPTKVSDLENDSGFLTQHQSLSGYVTTEALQTGLTAKENTSNKTSAVTEQNKSSTSQYPSVKAMADYVGSSLASHTPDMTGLMKLANPEISGILVPVNNDSEPDMNSNAFSSVAVGQIFVCVIDEEQTYWIKQGESSCKNLGSGGLAFDSGVVDSSGNLHLTLNGVDIEGFTPFYVGTGGGSGTAGINLSSVVKPTTVRNGANAIFSFVATSTDDTEVSVSWYVDNVLRETQNERASGSTFSFNAKDYLKQSDTSTVKASVSSSSGASLNRQWNITSTAFSLAFGVTIQPVTLYTANENVYVVVKVSAQALTENIVTVTLGNHSVEKSVIGSKEVTFELDKGWFSSGVNTVEVTMVSAIDENDEADPISYKAIWGYGASAPIVAFADSSLSVSQYDVAKIKYMVYDPDHETASCTMQIGTEAARNLSPNRTMQTMDYVPEEYGTKTATLTCGASSTTLTLNISQSQYNIGKITGDNLRFNLDPTGHSNSDADKTSFCNIIFSSGFDWVNGGFKTDTDGAPAFVVKKGHRATLPRYLFGDADGSGKTIDISFCVKNSDLYGAVAMQELNNGETKGVILRANEGELRLNNSTGQRFKYCEESRIDLSINVEAVNDHRVMTVWLDGIPSQANTYAAGTLVQTENALVIGSDHCDVWVYAIRVYNTSLSIRDMIQNYISLAPTTAKKVQRFQENDVYNSNGIITPTSLHEARPELTIITIAATELPKGKKDENYVAADISIVDGSTTLNFSKEDNTRYKCQGTSSMAYGRAAYNMDMEFSGTGETYAISSNSIPVTYLNIKVNVASSENANNVNAADWYNTYQPYIVPGRATPGVRDTIEGKPCAVFFKNTSQNTIWIGSQQVLPDQTVLYAMGDLCNSKKNKAVFAQTGTGEHYAKGCIEVSGNDTLAQQFKATSTYYAEEEEWQTSVVANGETTIQTDYEWRVKPKSADLNEVVMAWNNAVAWVVSTIGNSAKFKSEVGNYFAIDSLLFHFLYLEFFAAFDNVSKNTFYSYEWDETANKYLWNICKNYDDDTILGCDNDGVPLAEYGSDFGDTAGARSLFNADTNTIWLNIQAAFQTELAAMYLTLRGRGAWSAADIISKWDNYQHLRPHAAMAEDAYNKYILPYKTTGVVVGTETKSYDGSYLARLQGSKTYPRRQFLTYQAKYMDGKYGYYSTSDSIMFRANAASGTTKNLTIGVYAKTFVTLIVDNGTTVKHKIETGGTAVFQNVAVHSNATIYVTPESLVKSIVPIDDINNSTFSASGASKLMEVALGSSESENTAWDANTGLTIPSAVLKTLSIRNVVNFSQSLDLSANTDLESVDTRGTNAGIITLPSYAPLETVNLNACSGITALNLNAVETFSMASGNNLTEIHIENCNSVVNNAMLTYITQAANAGGNATRYIRMTGINWELNNPRVLNAIASKWKGYNSMGEQVDTPYLAGYVKISAMSQNNYQSLCETFPDLEIDEDFDEIPIYTVTFKNHDGTTLNTQSVEQGSAPIDPRSLPVNPISTPTKPSSISTTYTFDGWSWSNGGALISNFDGLEILADSVLYAHYAGAVRKYTVTWKDGADVLETQQADYGAQVTYSGDMPVSQSDGDYGMYKLFNGWDKSTSFVTADTEVQARWDSKPEPVNKTLSQMTPTELHALIMKGVLSPTGANNTVISSGDTIDIIAGHDFDYDNVVSHELVGMDNPQTFDGTNYFKPQIDNDDITLFDTEKSFVLAIDFAYNTSSDAGGCLASCYGSNGFMLRYSSGGQLRYGSGSNLQVSSNGVRQIVVIRKIAGDNKLYVYGSNKNGNALVYSALDQLSAPSHDAPLCFGAQMADDGYLGNFGKGTVYWAKLWDADLGDADCRQLAAWPRQKFTMQAVGSSEHAFRNFIRVDNQHYVNCAFLLKDLLEETHQMNPTQTNSGGWKATPMRTWLNARLFNALPILWQRLVLTVYVHSNTGYQSTTVVNPPAEDKIWIPSCKEVGFNVNSSPYSLESDSTFTVFTNDTSRIKKLNLGAGANNIYWLRSPHTTNRTNFYYVSAAGSSSSGNSNLSYGVAFGFCI